MINYYVPDQERQIEIIKKVNNRCVMLTEALSKVLCPTPIAITGRPWN